MDYKSYRYKKWLGYIRAGNLFAKFIVTAQILNIQTVGAYYIMKNLKFLPKKN